jgi:hypothetical protein
MLVDLALPGLATGVLKMGEDASALFFPSPMPGPCQSFDGYAESQSETDDSA